MRVDGTGGGPLLRVRATHLLLGVSANDAGDALTVVEDSETSSVAGAGSPWAVFVPSPLPCGECPYCRRALVSACRHLRVGLSLARPRGVDLPDRFLTPISEPAWAVLPPTSVAAAGLVAQLIDATARAGLGPGDTAIWLGAEPWAGLGAAFSARRSCRTFRLADRLSAGGPGLETTAPVSEAGESIVTLDPNAGDESWAAIIGAAEASSGSGHGRPERRIFVTDASAAAAAAALRLAAPGATLSFLRGVPATLSGLDRVGTLRVLVGGGYHPDLIPEALAALARGDVDVSAAIRPVTPAQVAGALADLNSGRDTRLPLVALT